MTTLPKAGTKLAERILINLGLRKAAADALEDGQFFSRHERYEASLFDQHPDARFICLIRDPRDMLLSLARYAAEGEGGILAASSVRLSRSEHELQALLFMGVLLKRLTIFGGWTEDPRCLVLRFEDLVGDRFGGSADARMSSARRLGDWLSFPVADVLAAMDVGEDTPTFRRGMVGAWRTELAPEVAQEMTGLIGDRMAAWGYEV